MSLTTLNIIFQLLLTWEMEENTEYVGSKHFIQEYVNYGSGWYLGDLKVPDDSLMLLST